MSDPQKQELFKDNSAELLAQSDAGAVARATQEIQASLVIAQRFPRDEVRARERILTACKRKGLAEVAEYEYSRGGTKILGPTIDLLRAIASRWGNLLFGWSEVERRNGQSSIRTWAWDTQSNSRAERTFVVKHWRDKSEGGTELTSERDIYEMLSNHASRRVRACLEEVIDSDVIAEAVDQCRKTLREGEKTPLVDRVVAMVAAFKEQGVTQQQIEIRLGNKADAISENQLASLRRVFKAIKDGVGQPSDYFKDAPSKPEFDGQSQPNASEPEQTPEPTPEPAKTAAYNPLKALRNLIKMSGLKEATLLDFWAATGASDGSSGSLEEVAMTPSGGELIKQSAENWGPLAAKIKEQAKKAGVE